MIEALRYGPAGSAKVSDLDACILRLRGDEQNISTRQITQIDGFVSGNINTVRCIWRETAIKKTRGKLNRRCRQPFDRTRIGAENTSIAIDIGYDYCRIPMNFIDTIFVVSIGYYHKMHEPDNVSSCRYTCRLTEMCQTNK